MCGIVGFTTTAGHDPAAAKRMAQAMADLIRHRGPDGEGYYADAYAALGHRRLSIIDLAGGGQPMFNEDGTLVVVFNGEIYNYKPLRAELRRLGHTFATDSDTEVRFDPEHKKGISNLMTIYSASTGKTFPEIEAEFAGRGYGDFKTAVGEAVVEELRPIRERFDALRQDKAYLEDCYRKGAERALAISQRTLDKVYKKVGFLK